MRKPGSKAASVAVHARLRVMWRGEIALGPGKAELLALIRETGSIHEAARKMSMSYMRAWSLIQTMNHCFKEPLVEASRGGRHGGGAQLTPAGARTLELYQRMEKASVAAMQPGWAALGKLLRDPKAE